uniref:Gp2 n=1 Tax=Picalivirus D TaxID=1419328 RepID=V5L182_9VIRU|nr:gp2 [Picalivirus D]
MQTRHFTTCIASTTPQSTTTLKTDEFVGAIDASVAPTPSNIISFSDVPQVVTAPVAKDAHSPSHFPSDAPNEMMARVRKLIPFVWTTTQAAESVYGISPINELLNSLATSVDYTHWEFVKYRRCVIRLTLNTSRFYRGALLLTMVPGTIGSTQQDRYSSLPLSTLPSTIIDATSTSTVEIAIPWLSTRPKEPTSFFTGFNPGFLALTVLSPLVSESDLGVTVAASLSLEAYFDSPELFDPSDTGLTVPPLAARLVIPPKAITPAYTQGPGTRAVSQEAAAKVEKGTLTQIAETVSSISSSLSSVPLIGGFATGVSLISSALGSVFDWFGLSKPLNVSTPRYVIPTRDMFIQTFHGVLASSPLSCDILPYVSTDPHLVADTSDGCSLMRLACTPSLIQKYNLVNTVPSTPILLGTLAVAPNVGYTDGTNTAFSNSGYAASFFRYWRGTMAFKVYIPASVMSRTRLVITHSFDRPTVWSENLRAEYYEIQGSTTIDIEVPWIMPDPYMPLSLPTKNTAQNPNANGYLTLWSATSLVNDNPGVSPPPLTAFIWSMCTPQTQFAGYRNPTASRLVSFTNAQGSFSARSTDMVDGITCETDIVSLREILHRPYTTLPATVVPAVAPAAFSVLTSPLIKYILYKFRYFRGSFNVTFRARAPFTGPIIIANTIDPDEGVYWYNSESPTFTVTVPYSSSAVARTTASFAPIVSLPQIYLSAPYAAANVILDVSISMGDDFSVGVQGFSPYLIG